MKNILLFFCLWHFGSGQVLLGGYVEQFPPFPEIEKVAEKATDLHFQDSFSNSSLTTYVLRAFTQVVAGINYKLKIKVGPEVCATQGDSPKCVLNQEAFCEYLVFEQVWTNTFDLTSANCSKFSTAWTKVFKNSNVIQEATLVALRKIFGQGKNSLDLDRFYINTAFVNNQASNVYKISLSVTNSQSQMRTYYSLSFLVENKSGMYNLLSCSTSSSQISATTSCSINN